MILKNVFVNSSIRCEHKIRLFAYLIIDDGMKFNASSGVVTHVMFILHISGSLHYNTATCVISKVLRVSVCIYIYLEFVVLLTHAEATAHRYAYSQRRTRSHTNNGPHVSTDPHGEKPLQGLR